MQLSAQAVEASRAAVSARLGIDLSRTPRDKLQVALAHALKDSSGRMAAESLQRLADLPDESPVLTGLASFLTVSETYFFRDTACFEALERHVLPALIAERRRRGVLRLRLWSAGCASGEEAYSLAMLLDRLLPDFPQWSVTLLATDINPRGLQAAREGRYREWSLRKTSVETRMRYFTKRRAGEFELDPAIRQMVTFSPLNLASDVYPTMMTNTVAMDLILCRNVLMYFTPNAFGEAAVRLGRALSHGGWLAVSPVEMSSEIFHPLRPVNFAGASFYRRQPLEERASVSASRAELPDRALPLPATADTAVEPKVRPHSTPLQHDLQLNPSPSVLARARELADLNELGAARTLCETTLQRDPFDLEAYLLLATIRHEQGETTAALAALRHAVYVAPDRAEPYFLLGSIFLQQGRRARGRRCMETAIDLTKRMPPQDPVACGEGMSAKQLLETAQLYLQLK